MTRARIAGIGDTRFGRHEGRDTLDLMAEAASAALADAGRERGEVDGLLTGYSTAMPHIMMATLFAEHYGLDPAYAHALSCGGATGGAMLMLAKVLVESGQCRSVLVVAGENRLTNEGGRDDAIKALAQVGHAETEVPYGATIPGYYALLASLYMAAHGVTEPDLATFAVAMRENAARHPGAHLTAPITIDDVLASRPIATPLKLLDCCPISDGAAAFLVAADGAGPRLAGAGQAHRHQHVSALADLDDTGAARAAARAFAEAGLSAGDIDYLGIYDSFTITALILLEELGFSARGRAARDLAAGRYGIDAVPLNTHGGLLSFGHCGVAGGIAHVVETVRQMRGTAGARQAPRRPRTAFVHADGGVLSAHVSLVLAED
ncbi:thiolase family protein [Acuticoccus sp. I52.16.1]|uniref:thiolase family protein n=1 Tax=Acuticoccus sp. I52.16.1 TaxID=2928472 RepID=UPI001FD200BA|nr:thiolase family protein [Acuticoccus sp. I52.16.1]UOM35279.1 thiolase family protein [Acuticoccus sp. I52.16.1]